MYNSISLRGQFVHGLCLFLKVLFIPLIAYVLFLGYQYWKASTAPIAPLPSFGLESELPADMFVPGTLVYSALQPIDEEGNALPQVFEYSFSNKISQTKFRLPARTLSDVNNRYELMLAFIADTEDPDGFQPAWHDKTTKDYGPHLHVNGYNERDLMASPDDIHYAYSYQTSADIDSRDFTGRAIALHNFDEGTYVTIENADEPHFINDGTDLLYTKRDGVFRYNLATAESYLVSAAYTNLTTNVDIDVTSNTSQLVMTIPGLNLISVQQFNENLTTVEVGRLVTADTRYRHPVVSPDDRFYVVMAAKDAFYDEVTGAYSQIEAEVRLLDNKQLIDRVSFEGVIPATVELDAWKF